MTIELENRSQLLQLLLWRGMAMVLILLMVNWFYLPNIALDYHQLLAYIALLFVVFSVTQSFFFRRQWPVSIQLFFQFFSDILLVSLLVFVTGGYESPFILLFGLVIVAAGTQANVLLVLSIAVLACMGYLAAIYSFAWWQSVLLPLDATLTLLLQISVLLLVGGVMAVISRRHAALSDKSRHAAQQHQDFQALHTHLMASMQEGVLVLDEQLTIRDSNPAARAIFQVSENSQLKVTELYSFPQQVVRFLKSSAGEESYRCEWRQDKAEYLITVGKFSELYAGACWWLTLTDVSELRGLEKEVVEHQKLAAMGRMAAMLAHELRNPMQTIAQAVELVSRVGEKQQLDIQRIISEEILRLNRLVTDMLDYTKPLTPKPKDIEVFDLLIASVEQVDSEQKYFIDLECDVGILNIDADHMRLVLDNLLRNAVLSSPAPHSVSLHVSEHAGHWQFTVTDHGGGIPESIRAQIFEPFASQRAGGTGLGLATVWQVCHVNQWQIDVESDADTTTFRVWSEHAERESYG
ncbi:MAG: ATP-binding protein [Mariprofundaceae bacterium]|nr:ATP-binding protein [Mariprofundaceae bacterium]